MMDFWWLTKIGASQYEQINPSGAGIQQTCAGCMRSSTCGHDIINQYDVFVVHILRIADEGVLQVIDTCFFVHVRLTMGVMPSS